MNSLLLTIFSTSRRSIIQILTLRNLFHKKGNTSEAGKWLEIAVKNDASDSPELKAELGIILIKAVTDDQSSFFGIQINEAKRAQIERAIKLLTSAWDRVAKTSIRHCRADWVANRGLAKRLLADIDGAKLIGKKIVRIKIRKASLSTTFNLTLSAEPTSISSDGSTSNIKALLRNNSNNPIEGALITFEADHGKKRLGTANYSTSRKRLCFRSPASKAPQSKQCQFAPTSK